MNRLQQYLLIPLVCFIGYWIFQCFHLIDYPIPTEYRDWGSVDLSNALLHQSSPYSFSLGVPFFYIYGFIFPLLAGCLSWMLHIDVLLASKLLIFICIILTALIVGAEIQNLVAQRFLAILGFTATLWTGSATNAAFIVNPASCGLLIVVLVLSQIRRSQNNYSILLAALGTVIAFYTKQYYVFICAPIFLFLLSTSGFKKALTFGLLFLVALTLSAWFICQIFPAYFYATILAQFYAVGGGWGHARSQLILFFNQYWPFIIPVFIYLYGLSKKTIAIQDGEKLYLYVLLIAAICLIPLGRNTGSYLSYYYQLALPSLIIMGSISISKLKKAIVRQFFIIGAIIFSIFHGEFMNMHPIYSEQAKQNWNLAQKLISSPSIKGPILISTPILAPLQGEFIVLDNGHTECYLGLDTPSALLDLLFPKRHSYFESFQGYFANIDQQISHKDFKLIATTKDFHPMIPQSLLDNNYSKIETIRLQTGGQTWATEFWIPKN